jgi:predicted transcriptional regulator
MTEVPLIEYLRNKSQAQLADEVGCHQTAVSRMVRVNRPMFVVTHSDGRVELIERKFSKKTA